MSRFIYHRGGEEFTSQTTIKKRFAELRNKYPVGYLVSSGDEGFDFLASMFQWQEDVMDSDGDILNVVFTNHQTRGTSVPGVTLMMRIGGLIEYPSYKYGLCRSLADANTLRIKRREAKMREIVNVQIDSFKSTNEYACASCSTNYDLDVDHIDPTFKTIFNEWMELEGLDLSLLEFEVISVDGRVKLKDERLHQSWLKFHEDYAVLQYLCKPCHKHKTKVT